MPTCMSTFTSRSLRVGAACVLLSLSGACASGNGGRNHTSTKRALLGAFVATAGVGTAAAIVGERKERSLRDDIAAGTVSGTEYASRDLTGKRWNRLSRASFYVSGLMLLGLGVVYQSELGVRQLEDERGKNVGGAALPPPRPEDPAPTGYVPPLPGAAQSSTAAR
jgi:hypothetical protein